MQEPEFRDEGHRSEFENEDREGAARKEKDSFLSFLGELPVLIITAIVVAWLIKTFIVQPFYIPSSSMEPTLLPGDRVLVSKLSYRFAEPKPGNVVVFIAPEPQGVVETDFIKRIVAISGMRVEETNGRLLIDGKVQDEPFTRPDNPTNNYGPSTVPANKVFVMGDNRGNSKDSRYFGPINRDDLVGKAFFVYWPPGRAGLLK